MAILDEWKQAPCTAGMSPRVQYELDAADHSAVEAEWGGDEPDEWGQALCTAGMIKSPGVLHQPNAAVRSIVGAEQGWADEGATNPSHAMFTSGSMLLPPRGRGPAGRSGDERRVIDMLAIRCMEGQSWPMMHRGCPITAAIR